MGRGGEGWGEMRRDEMTEGYVLGMMLLYLFFKPDPATAILSGWFMGISCRIQ